jgi:hypothetical protein
MTDCLGLCIIGRALSQLLAINPQSVLFPVATESFLAYYDIFVRHAMGNYKDVLREVGE